MPATLTITDETTSGRKTNSFTMGCASQQLSLRELIQARIRQEVEGYNLEQPDCFRGLVAPTQADRTPLGYRLRERRPIDWQEQLARALEAFADQGFLVLVGDRVAKNLDEEFEITADTEISFIKLRPLVGG